MWEMLQHDYMLTEMCRSDPTGKGEIRCCRREREHCQRDVLSGVRGGEHSWRSHLETWCAQPIHCNRSKDWLKGSRPRRVLHWMMDACGTSLLIAPVLFACPVAAFPFLCSCFCTVCQCLHGQGLAGLWHASCELDAQIRPLVNNCMGTLKMKWTSRLGGSELPSWWLTHKLVERLSLEIG